MGKDISVGQMANTTKENMSKIRELEKDYMLGLMAQFIVALSLMARDTVKVFLNQQGEAFIVVNGLMI